MTDRQGTLQVRGTGKVQVAPDEAVIHLGIVTEGRTASDATAANARLTQAVIKAVAALPEHGITTEGLGVSPIVSYDPKTRVGTIVGFRATNGVQVKAKIGNAGQIYDAGIAAGATEASDITFRIQDETPFREEALRIAVENAFREAELVAKAANTELRGAESIQIDSGEERVFYRAAALDRAAPTTPVLPEERTISASVQISFRTCDF
jgi:uncharacterized protein YggE